MLVALALFAISVVYATVGQAGGTGFLAVMAMAGIPVDQLRPTALAMNVVAASYTSWRLHEAGLIDWRMLMSLAVPALPAAFVGGLIALPSGLYASVTGGLLLAAAVMMVARPVTALLPGIAASKVGLAGIGAAAGFLSGLSGIGGGVFIAPMLIVLGWARPKEAAGLSAPFILGNSLTGMAGTLLIGQQFAPELPLFACVALLGAAVGTAAILRISERMVRFVLAAVMAVAGLRLLAR
ncbi:MAG: hypothetical protein FD144_3631 [Rhodospirillaceae bacterium]|nr:MAG: hypothetical protein FD144_3631 [Rhodospirillaceae bacterium]